MRVRAFLPALILILVAAMATPEEGMWLYNAPPNAQIKAKYGFELTDPWLRHVQLSSVRFDNGGSGSFVSADGLTFTNHHIASGCLHNISTSKTDYMKTGFYAKNQSAEPKCPDLELNVLQNISDVTAAVDDAVKPGMNDAQAGAAQRAEMAALEKDCARAPDIRCDVVTLYAGAIYDLYRYKRYTDVRLVFAPEFQTAFFGGDPDNFEYPRYDLDIAFFRVYENNQPVHLENYLHWSPNGAKENDLVFVSGHPGSTGRENTMNQLEFLKNVQFPFILKDLHRRIELHQKFASESAENARIAQEHIFGLQNSYKAYTGFNYGLNDRNLMNLKKGDERKLLFMASRSAERPRILHAFQQIDAAIAVHHKIFLPYRYLELLAGFRGQLNQYARTLVRAGVEKQKPNGERLREYRDSALPSLEQEIFSTAPIYKSMEIVEFADSLTAMQQDLGADNAIVKRVIEGRSPKEVATAAINGTKLDDPNFRKQLYEAGPDAIAKSNDPMIVIMREIDPDARTVRKQYDDEVDSPIRVNHALIEKFRFEHGGSSTPPDATFTLRLSYGAVTGYVEDGRGIVPAGTRVAPFTDFAGAFKHAAQHGDEDPYRLATSWMRAKSKVKLATRLNFVSTADIIGGNSGSPVVDEKGDIVGIIFDTNIQALPWNFMYDDEVGRAVSVDSRGIVEALRNIYHANGLVKELTESAQESPARIKKQGVKK
jgi:hypothetical protein